MEIRRYLNTRIWGESWFEPLTATEKLIWIYLLTNPATNMLGIYGLTVRRIGYDCNTSAQIVRRCIKKLEELKLIIMIHEHIIITHWLTQNAMNPSMKLSALKDFDNLPDKVRAALPVKQHSENENRHRTACPTHSPSFTLPDTGKGRGNPKRTGTGKQNKNSKRKHPPTARPGL